MSKQIKIPLPTKQDVDGHVGKRLRLRRTMMGLSQEAVAKAVGITFQQVQKYEKGSNAMNAARLVEFARFMNVPVAYFFEGLEGYATSSATPTGFAEDAVEFEFEGGVSERESLEMMKAFKRIKEQPIRKRLSDLVRAVAENKPLLD
ncbi:MAG: helix-turn-helix domain-containing protein [Alphaproteobacteria bacterium]|nr:helix-turn-helix domain-containing protein [Alphaproteobacteria bacterium]